MGSARNHLVDNCADGWFRGPTGDGLCRRQPLSSPATDSTECNWGVDGAAGCAVYDNPKGTQTRPEQRATCHSAAERLGKAPSLVAPLRITRRAARTELVEDTTLNLRSGHVACLPKRPHFNAASSGHWRAAQRRNDCRLWRALAAGWTRSEGRWCR